MAQIELPSDFRELLRLLNAHGAEYLLVGGYAVGIHGYVRATGDIDIWIKCSADNSAKVTRALSDFGFNLDATHQQLLQQAQQIIRMGVPPLRAEIMTSIDGVDFDECWPVRLNVVVDGTSIPVINLPDLIKNKRASGRLKDLADIDELPND